MIYTFTSPGGQELSCDGSNPLTMEDGSTKLAEDVAVGDRVFVRTFGCCIEVDSIATA